MVKSFLLTCGIALAACATTASAESRGFKAPSGNILCYVDNYDWQTGNLQPVSKRPLVCLVWEAQWTPPLDFGDDDPTCDLDQTRMLVLPPKGSGKSRWACHGDVFWPLPLPTLGYGSRWALSGYSCSMKKDGVRCSNRTGDGFHIRRAALKFY